MPLIAWSVTCKVQVTMPLIVWSVTCEVQVKMPLILQLDEDVRVLLQRLDAETADETETKSKCVLFLCVCITCI